MTIIIITAAANSTEYLAEQVSTLNTLEPGAAQLHRAENMHVQALALVCVCVWCCIIVARWSRKPAQPLGSRSMSE